MHEKKALTREVSKRYQQAGKKEKTRILDELVKTTGYNRKYAVHLLANWGKTTTVRIGEETVRLEATRSRKRRKGGGRKPIYAGEFAVVLRATWAFFSYRCGKILAPFMRQQMPFLEAPFGITAEVRELLLKVSPSTIDRVLKADKKKLAIKGKCATRAGTLLKKQIPIRTYYADADKQPGFLEADTVHHCGASESGEFCLTLTATDVYSGWVELRPTLNKAHKWVFQALDDIRSSLPFPLLGLDSDNGAEFINAALLAWCGQQRIQFTRARPYRKNDNCYVEQKNCSCVRNFVGYCRFSAAAERDALAAVYRCLCPLLNFFIPTLKLISTTRVGSEIKKVYDTNIISPYQRLLASPDLADNVKAELTKRFGQYNPVTLQQEVHDAVEALVKLRKRQQLERAESLAISTLQAT
jgi:hypothetical protein